jgi:hypothetical protein
LAKFERLESAGILTWTLFGVGVKDIESGRQIRRLFHPDVSPQYCSERRFLSFSPISALRCMPRVCQLAHHPLSSTTLL